MSAFLINHGEKLACAVILAACLVFVTGKAGDSRCPAPEGLDDAMLRIRAVLEQGEPLKDYPAPRVDYAGDLARSVNSLLEPAGEALPAFLSYPRPDAPEISGGPPPVDTIPLELPAPADLVVQPAEGFLRVSWGKPGEAKYCRPVRIELYRSLAADQVGGKVCQIQLNNADTPAGAHTAPDQPGAGAHEASGATKRSLRLGPSAARTSGPPRVFEDFNVAPRTAYYYRARVVAQATKPEPGEITVVDGKPVRLVLPKDIAELPREAPGGRLFASAWTPVASATTAPHYRVRFTGTADPVAHDQARAGGASEAFFAVRVWRKEAPGWTEAHIKVRPGAPLSGTLPIKDANGEEVPFDTGWILAEVRPGLMVEQTTRDVPLTREETDPDTGAQVPVLVTGRNGRYTTRKETLVTQVPVKVALLKNAATGRIERCPQRPAGEWGPSRDLKIVLEGDEPAP